MRIPEESILAKYEGNLFSTLKRSDTMNEDSLGTTMNDTTTQTTFEVTVPPVNLSKGQREYRSFLRLLPQLLTTHRGQFVAVHEGKVVDTETDDIALVRRVHAQIGYVPIHVGLVTEQPPVVRIPHYREFRNGE